MISLKVRNTGDRKGDEIVQVYLGKAEAPAWIQMAEKQLCGYARVRGLEPGESRTVSIRVEGNMLCYWDPSLPLTERKDGTADKWHRATGNRTVYIARSSRDIRLIDNIILS